MSATSDVKELALLELVRQLAEMDGHRKVLADAIADIEAIAEDHIDLDAHSWNSVFHICTTGGVKAAMDPTT